MKFVLDIPANIHRNDADRMALIFATIPKTEQFTFCVKTQYWHADNKQGKNQPTTEQGLRDFFRLAKEHGFPFGSSAFDRWSMQDLIDQGPDFIKIACQPILYHLSRMVPRGIECLMSYDCRASTSDIVKPYIVMPMTCVPEYPAKTADYKIQLTGSMSVSDHTTDDRLFNMAHWVWYECHYCLKHDPAIPDAGPFARTPQDLKRLVNPRRRTIRPHPARPGKARQCRTSALKS